MLFLRLKSRNIAMPATPATARLTGPITGNETDLFCKNSNTMIYYLLSNRNKTIPPPTNKAVDPNGLAKKSLLPVNNS